MGEGLDLPELSSGLRSPVSKRQGIGRDPERPGELAHALQRGLGVADFIAVHMSESLAWWA
jgi:hypothetical protein